MMSQISKNSVCPLKNTEFSLIILKDINRNIRTLLELKIWLN